MTEVKITKFDNFGRGICFIDNKITFIKNALPNEVVDCMITKSKSKYNEGKVIKIKRISEERVEPFCPYYKECGGCHLEHLSYPYTLQFKKEKIENILNHEKIEFPSIQVIENTMPLLYRNKITLKIEDGKLGFYEENTHTLIEIKECLLAKKSINKCMEKLKTLQIKKGSITIRFNYNDEILLIIDTNDKVEFKEKNFEYIKLVGVVVNNKTIYGTDFFIEKMNGTLFKVSYDAFFQVNLNVTCELFKIVENNLDKTNNILDLYAGVGTLGIIASSVSNKVFSIEIVKNAVLDILENKKLNKKENIFPILGDAKEILPQIKENFDTIIIDPPRKGLDKNSKELIINSQAKKLIYISCDPMTLARDLSVLTEKYTIKKLYILDMFSYTYHVECVCVLNRR